MSGHQIGMLRWMLAESCKPNLKNGKFKASKIEWNIIFKQLHQKSEDRVLEALYEVLDNERRLNIN